MGVEWNRGGISEELENGWKRTDGYFRVFLPPRFVYIVSPSCTFASMTGAAHISFLTLFFSK
jgi:hypothetical protein